MSTYNVGKVRIEARSDQGPGCVPLGRGHGGCTIVRLCQPL